MTSAVFDFPSINRILNRRTQLEAAKIDMPPDIAWEDIRQELLGLEALPPGFDLEIRGFINKPSVKYLCLLDGRGCAVGIYSNQVISGVYREWYLECLEVMEWDTSRKNYHPPKVRALTDKIELVVDDIYVKQWINSAIHIQYQHQDENHWSGKWNYIGVAQNNL